MKTILFFAGILLTTVTQAAPAVGDFVRYKMTTVANGMTQIAEQKIEVLSINTQSNSYTFRTSILFNGTQISAEEQTSDLDSAIESETVLDHCKEMPADMASIETITVPAGKFQVCHIKTEQGGMKMDQYMGKVLFGLVKSVTSDLNTKTSVVFELVEVKKH
jgi:hypothetical protein